MRSRNYALILLGVLSFGWVGHMVTHYFIMDPQAGKFLVHKILSDTFNKTAWLVFLRAHIILSSLALVTGPLGFSKRLVKKNKLLHRTIGGIYMVSVLLSALTAVYLTPFVTGGVVSMIGFALLIILWISSTVLAFVKIRRKQIEQHREWMIRSFAFTLANTTLHLVLPVLTMMNVEYNLSYSISVWAGWIINFAVAEMIINRAEKKERAALLTTT